MRLRALGVAALMALKIPLDLVPALSLSPDAREVLAIDAALQQAGMARTQEVLSTSSDYYGVASLGRFERWESDQPEPVADLHQLVSMMRRRGYRFVVYDGEYGVQKVLPHLAILLEPARVPPELLEWIFGPHGQDSAVVYKLPSPGKVTEDAARAPGRLAH